MKRVDREEFSRYLCKIPGHVRTVETPGNAIEYWYAQELVGVLVRADPHLNSPARRLIPENAHSRR